MSEISAPTTGEVDKPGKWQLAPISEPLLASGLKLLETIEDTDTLRDIYNGYAGFFEKAPGAARRFRAAIMTNLGEKNEQLPEEKMAPVRIGACIFSASLLAQENETTHAIAKLTAARTSLQPEVVWEIDKQLVVWLNQFLETKGFDRITIAPVDFVLMRQTAVNILEDFGADSDELLAPFFNDERDDDDFDDERPNG